MSIYLVIIEHFRDVMTTMGFRHYESCSRTQVVNVGYEKDTRNPVTMRVRGYTAFCGKDKLKWKAGGTACTD